MARSDLQTIFEAVGLPVVMGHWSKDETVQWPFLEYHREADASDIADNSVYRRVDGWEVSIYAHDDDMTTFYSHCETLEAALDEAGIIAYRSADIFTGEGTVYASFTFDLPR